MRSARLNGSAEINQSSEMDVGKNSHELAHASGALRQVENGADEVAAKGLEDLLRRGQRSQQVRLRTSSMNFTDYARSYRPI
jgi:hypothetical protein